MSQINSKDKDLIEQIKKGIERASGAPSPENWVQKDYDFLVYFIEEKTGDRISLSTLKRIWKNENNRLPHISTLNALSQVAFEKDWLSLKNTYLGVNENEIDSGQRVSWYNSEFVKYTLVFMTWALVLFAGFKFYKRQNKNIIHNTKNVLFSARTSIESSVPNSVVFTYDVSDIEADKFYIQQNWDKRRRVEISKANRTQTDIYYLPGFYKAKLIADSTILKETGVHITTEDWFPMLIQDENQIPFEPNSPEEDYLSINTKELGLKKIDLNQPFLTAYYNSREFRVDGDNFRFSTSFKLEQSETIPCQGLGLFVKGASDYFIIQLGNSGCESDLGLRFGDISYDGKTNDLTKLGTDVYNWQNMELVVKDKNAQLILNEELIFESTFAKDIGDIKEITYFFSGVGLLDNVVLEDGDGEIQYSDMFNE